MYLGEKGAQEPARRLADRKTGAMAEYKMLIPLDGSRYSEHALAFLPSMRHIGEVKLELLGVVDDADYVQEPSPTEQEERERNVLSSYLHEIASDIEKHLEITASADLERGNPAEVIVEAARRADADAIVISTHGRTGITRWRRGSVADKVVRTAHGPVLMVGPRAMEKGQWLEAETVPPFQRILVPLDGSEAAEKALAPAARYAQAFGSELHLYQGIKLGGRFDIVPDYPQDVMDDIVASGVRYLTEAIARAGLPDGAVKSAEVGMPTVLLEDYIADKDIDLVVMTSHGRGGVTRAALGSVTDRLIGVGPPVLVVR
jgi:nucleotide-binding universal stress UspA family protein